MRLAKVLGAIGRTFITGGVLILLFVAYQLWGTGIREAQAQGRLDNDFAEALADAAQGPGTTLTPAPGDPETVPPIDPVPEGDPVARIRIPEIGVDKVVVEGVSVSALKKGPGHYADTPLPGQEGNASIAGHRTTYGAPFNRIDELEPGDEILVETVQGEFRYLVEGTEIVQPSQVEVLEDKDDNRLTLTSCHPKYSARQRIIVVAQLAPGLIALPSAPSTTPPSLDDIGGEGAAIWPVLVLAAVAALIWLLAWFVGRKWKKLPAYALALPFFAVSLFYFFEEFSRLLPSSY